MHTRTHTHTTSCRQASGSRPPLFDLLLLLLLPLPLPLLLLLLLSTRRNNKKSTTTTSPRTGVAERGHHRPHHGSAPARPCVSAPVQPRASSSCAYTGAASASSTASVPLAAAGTAGGVAGSRGGHAAELVGTVVGAL